MNQFIYFMADTSAVWSDSVKLGADDLMGHMYVYILEIFWQSSRSGSIAVRTTTRTEPLFVRKLVPKIPNTAEKRLKNEVFYNCKFEGEGSSLTLSEFRYLDTS